MLCHVPGFALRPKTPKKKNLFDSIALVIPLLRVPCRLSILCINHATQEPSEQAKYAGSHVYKSVSDAGGDNVQAESLGSDGGVAHRPRVVCWCCAVVNAVAMDHLLHAAFCISCKFRITSRQPCLILIPSIPRKSGVRFSEDSLQ